MTFSEFKDRFFVIRKCIGCGRILEHNERKNVFCSSCALSWSVAKTESCKKCFQSAIECSCQPKELAKTGSLCLRKLIFYHKKSGTPPQLRIVYRLKHRPHKLAEQFLAKEISWVMSEELNALEIKDLSKEAVIASMPRSKRSARRYGIDQSERVARAISAETGVPYVKAIKRSKLFSKEQKQLTKQGRFKSVRGQFVISEALVEGKYVFLYDDIVTTGASMTACSELLRKAGAKAIVCMCVAQN
jgi:ComF family protein